MKQKNLNTIFDLAFVVFTISLCLFIFFQKHTSLVNNEINLNIANYESLSNPNKRANDKIEEERKPVSGDVDTTNWNYYQNAKFLYELKYPEDWLLEPTASNVDYAVFYPSKNTTDHSGGFLAVRIHNNAEGLNIKEWWGNRDALDGADYEYMGRQFVNNVASDNYIEIGGLGERHTVLMHNQNIIHIFGIAKESIYTVFLNTLRFNKIYKNGEFGFEISYPLNWYQGQTKGGETTPLGVYFSDDEEYIKNGRLTPTQPYPENFFQLSIFNTTDHPDIYIKSDFKAKNITNYTTSNIIIDGVEGIMVKSDINGEYLSAYVSNGKYLYIFEAPNNSKTNKIEAFQTWVTSMQFSKR